MPNPRSLAHTTPFIAASVLATAALTQSPPTGPEPSAKLHPLIHDAYPAWAVLSQPDQGPADLNSPAQSNEPASILVVAVVLFDAELTSDERTAIVTGASLTARSTLTALPAAVVEGPLDAVLTLADHTAVRWIEPPLPALTPTNADVRATLHADALTATPFALTGAGINVAVWDVGRVLTTHADFGNRVVPVDPGTLNDHATHVAGTIAASGFRSGSGITSHRGIAHHATIFSYIAGLGTGGTALYSDPLDLEQDLLHAFNTNNAHILNASVGSNVADNNLPCSITGNYGITSALFDALIHNNQPSPPLAGNPVRVVLAGGNERGSFNCGTAYATIAPPAAAKNPIVVGAVNTGSASMTDFSSWGPTDDGRIKPDIVAPGCQIGFDNGITSTSITGDYSVKCGTSMAAPAVSGLLALLIEDFHNVHPHRPQPTNALLKAMLAHTAIDLGNTGPDFRFGFGLADAQALIELNRAGRFDEFVVDLAAPATARVLVDPSDPYLTLTLAWDDPPGLPGTPHALVHNLDLVVTSPTGVRAHPWTLTPTDPSRPAVRTAPDARNTIEQVRVDAPEPGWWTVEIQPTADLTSPQPAAIASSHDLTRAGLTLLTDIPTWILPADTPTLTLESVGVQNPSLALRYRPTHDAPELTTFVAPDPAPIGLDTHRFSVSLPPAACADAPAYSFELFDAGQLVARMPELGSYAHNVGESVVHFDDDAETDQGWSYSAPSDTATDGFWARAVPIATFTVETPPIGPAQSAPGEDTSPDGTLAFLTGPAGGSAGADDVDAGTTTLTSPPIDLIGYPEAVLRAQLWYANHAGSDAFDDVLTIDVTSGTAGIWANALIVGPGPEGAQGGWREITFPIGAIAPTLDDVRVRFVADDASRGFDGTLPSLVEAALDEVTIITQRCFDPPAQTPCPGDVDGNRLVNATDFFAIIQHFGLTIDDTFTYDAGGDGIIGADDFFAVIQHFGQVCD